MERKRILIIDDDADLRVGLNARLRANGYDTAFAADGATAISMARKAQPDLILLDIGLPAGDGFVVLDRLRSNASLACTPVIVLTARDAEATRKRALEAGAVAFFQKPADNAELLDAIGFHAGRPAAAGAQAAQP